MDDESAGDPKVIRWPLRIHATDPTVDDPPSPRVDITQQVLRALDEHARESQSDVHDEPQPERPVHDRRQVPDPTHRNAVQCTQCDGVIWRAAWTCSHCGLDVAGEKRKAEAMRRGRFWKRWASGFGVVGGAVLIYSFSLPLALAWATAVIGLVVIYLGLLCLNNAP
jgi:hypothetical protein